MSNCRFRIFQPVVPEYRKALFEGLGLRYGDRIEVWADDRVGVNNISVPLEHMRYDYAHEYRHKFGLVWQSGFSLRGLIRGDVIVVCGDVRQLCMLWMAFVAKCRGIKVIWWGHHVSAHAQEGRTRIRLCIAKWLSNSMLCYTDAGITFLRQRGFRHVYATGNTIDMESVNKAIADWGEEKIGRFKAEHGLVDCKVLLFCGVMREKARIDVLLRAFKQMKPDENNLKLVIIGDGAKFQEWYELGDELMVNSRVIWLGELRGQDRLAPWFLCADVFAYPGSVGLSLLHSFSFALPVVVNDDREDHGPEYAAVFRNGENGFAFKAGDENDFAAVLVRALSDKEMLSCMGRRGQEFVRANYSMSNMIERFSEALEKTAALK